MKRMTYSEAYHILYNKKFAKHTEFTREQLEAIKVALRALRKA